MENRDNRKDAGIRSSRVESREWRFDKSKVLRFCLAYSYIDPEYISEHSGGTKTLPRPLIIPPDHYWWTNISFLDFLELPMDFKPHSSHTHPTTHYLPPTTYYLLPFTSYLRPTAYNLQPIIKFISNVFNYLIIIVFICHGTNYYLLHIKWTLS